MDATETRRLTRRLRKFIHVRQFERFYDEGDLVQIGLLAAVAAEVRFDVSKGRPLWVWRAIRAEGAIKDVVRDESQVRLKNRLKIVSSDDMTEGLLDLLRPPSLSAEDEYLNTTFLHDQFLEFMRYLAEQPNPDLWIVAQSVYGEDQPYRTVACFLALTEARVSQLLKEIREHARWWWARH